MFWSNRCCGRTARCTHSFNYLVYQITPFILHIHKMPISVPERLLASDSSWMSVATSFKLWITTVSSILSEVTKAMWLALQLGVCGGGSCTRLLAAVDLSKLCWSDSWEACKNQSSAMSRKWALQKHNLSLSAPRHCTCLWEMLRVNCTSTTCVHNQVCCRNVRKRC